MIEIDGSEGEGGGQILRSSLSLSICTEQPFRIANIRANREKPGLLRQHLTAVKAAAEICCGSVSGAELGSRELVFIPGKLKAGDYSFAIGTAGSCTLVLQTVLPALLAANSESTVRITGGTHNKGAPPFDFLQRSFLPLLARMGAEVSIELKAYGFYPKGGGEIRARIKPARLTRLDLTQRGERVRAFAEAYVAALPIDIARRELDVIGRRLNWSADQLHLRGLANDLGSGNAVTVTIEHANVTEVFSGFGERGVRAEEVAERASDDARRYMASQAAVDEHLADQLLLPMVLASGGVFTTTAITQHLRSNAIVIEKFTKRRTVIAPSGDGFLISMD